MFSSPRSGGLATTARVAGLAFLGHGAWMSGPASARAEALGEEARTALVRQIRRIPPPTSQRGTRYAAEGRVRLVSFGPTRIRATVRGAGASYETEWSRPPHAPGWWSHCSCPVEIDCKHAYATAVVALGLTAGATSGSAGPLFGRSPADRLARLRGASSIWEMRSALIDLVGPGPLSDRLVAPGEPGGELARLFESREPDLLCFRLAQILTESGVATLPEALQGFAGRADLAERLDRRRRVELRTALDRWILDTPRSAARGLRLVFDLTRDGAGDVEFTVEARVASARGGERARPLPSLAQLRTELRRAPDLLPPDEAALLLWLVDRCGVAHPAAGPRPPLGLVHELAERVAGSALGAWSMDVDPDLARRAGITPGGALRVATQPAHLLPDYVDDAADPRLELRLVLPDEVSRSLDDVVLVRPLSFGSTVAPGGVALTDGIIFAIGAEPDLELQRRFATTGGLHLDRAERLPVLLGFAERMPHLRRAIASHTHEILVRPVVLLDLRDDDWLQIRLLGVARGVRWAPGGWPQSPLEVFERAPWGGWDDIAARVTAGLAPGGAGGASELQSLTSVASTHAAADEPIDPRVAAEVWRAVPTGAGLDAAVRWLDELRAATGQRRGGRPTEPDWEDRGTGIWLRLDEARVEALVGLWERRPAELEFFGNRRVRRLLLGEDVVQARIAIVSSGLDWLAVDASWEAEGLALTDQDLAALHRSSRGFVRLSAGWVRREAAAHVDAAAQALADLGIDLEFGGVAEAGAAGAPQRLSIWQLAGASAASLDALERAGAGTGTVRAVRELRARIAAFTGLPVVPVPGSVQATLRPYQQRGLDFLAHASTFVPVESGAGTSGALGVILADDMGLGKTLQALAWLEHLRAEDPDGGPSLVVCPASVVHNWRREAERFVPGLRVLLVERGSRRRALREQLAECDLAVTNYALLRRDAAEWATVDLRAAILDEAQNVKNPDAAVSRAARALRARHRLALTGTPLENRPLDLWSIASFASPGVLGSRRAFTERYDRPDLPPHRRALLAARMRPFLLRRLKSEVARDLPDRVEERIDCELTAGQRQLYLAELRRCRALIAELPEEDRGGVKGKGKIQVLAALTRLRQVCCHPALAGGDPAHGSGKFDVLFELLEPILAEGHKVLLFSQFVECLKLLAAELDQRGIARHLLTGASTRREAILQRFADDPRPAVFLLSLKAGGAGLNLTAASYVVLFDPWWNPAVEAQAIDRAHRIGQDRTVIAYRLVARGTLEEKIGELQAAKSSLVRDILGDGGLGRDLGRDDLARLLEPEPEAAE